MSLLQRPLVSDSGVCVCVCVSVAPPSTQQQPAEYFDMGVFLAFFVVVSLVCLVLLVKIKLKQRRSQVSKVNNKNIIIFNCNNKLNYVNWKNIIEVNLFNH